MRFKVRIEGTRPLIIQSDRLADPLDEVARELALASKNTKEKKTEKGQHLIARLEWTGALYCDDDGKPSFAIPGDNILRALRDAATTDKLGETVKREVIVEEWLIPIEHGGPTDIDKMYSDPRFVFRKTVVVNKGSRTPRTRPRVPPPWALSFALRVDGAKTLRADDVRRFLDRAGVTGIGTWRPRYGHFRVAKFDAVED